MKKHLFFITLLAAIIFTACTKTKEKPISIIPQPKEITKAEGHFTFDEKTQIYISDETQRPVAEQLQEKFNNAAGLTLTIVTEPVSDNFVAFVNDDSLGKESYTLEANEKGITIKANDYAGFVYGWSSLRQLLPNAIESSTKVSEKWIVPAVNIQDAPRFAWRGLMLDLSRHFFEKDYILKTIDRLALLKMNTLHLHLVDDQGWRIEIKKYPKLTEVGAWRVDRSGDHFNARAPQQPGEKATYGGFLTQEDIREIVAYATERGINVVPEIEMPAHVTSAIAAYPELSCHKKPVTVPTGGVWPITDIYCAGDEKSFEFLENVLLEVMELFPSKYIHVGGDEATKTNWAKCPKCKVRMRKEKLQSVEELQSYFIKRMERFISSKGRILIGWDEIIEGGLAQGATVMSWRGVKGGLEASAQGHDVVMTPGEYCYFDHYQGKQDVEPLAIGGYSPLGKVYEFDPVVDEMTEAQVKHVLGGQANLWSEYITTPEHSEYMIFPRLAALAEAVWTPKDKKNKEDFLNRVRYFMERLDIMGVNYAKSAFDIVEDTEVHNDKTITLSLSNEFKDTDIHYAIDADEVNEDSPIYKEPIQLAKTTTIKAAAYKNGKQVSKVWEKHINFHKAIAQKVTYEELYDKRYDGGKEVGLVNILRGSTNFHDGQWQGWEGKDMTVTIQLEKETEVSKVTVGSMENQASHIYFPIAVEVWLSNDGKTFTSVGKITRPYEKSGYNVLKDFTITFAPQTTQYIKVKATNIGDAPLTSDAWLFVDEVVVE